MDTIKKYTISVFTENHIGLLNRITIIFTRRRLNIESLNTSESEIEGVHRFTIVVSTTEEVLIKLVKQIEKQIEVIRAFYHLDDDTVFQEIALYKVPSNSIVNGIKIESLIREEVTELGSKAGGLMMIYGLYPNVPLENVKALMDAMERYAFYYSD